MGLVKPDPNPKPIDYSPLFDRIKERPDEESTLVSLPPCPHCNAPTPPQDIRGGCRTCIGTMGVDLDKHPEQDPNHVWRSLTCEACGHHYCIESKYANIWVTVKGGKDNKENIVARGMPSCFESYVYHCAKCDHGLVRQEAYKKDEAEPLGTPWRAYDPEKGGKQYRTTFYCDRCGERIITEFDDWSCPPPPYERTPQEEEDQKKLREWVKGGCVCCEVAGASIGHTAGLVRADFE